MANLIPQGTYNARAVPESAQWGVSSKGNEQIAIRFKISEGQFAGREVLWIGNFAAGEATDISMDALEAAGVDLDQDIAQLVGLGTVDVQCVVEWRDREDGTPYASVRYVNRPNRPVFKAALSEDGITSLSARLAARRAEVKANPPPPRSRKGSGAQQRTDENGMPLDSDGKPAF